MSEQPQPVPETIKKKEYEISPDKARMLGGFLEAKIHVPLEQIRTDILTMTGDAKFARDVASMQTGLNNIDRVIYGLRTADTIKTSAAVDDTDPDFSFTYKQQVSEVPPLPTENITLQDTDYRNIMRTLTHQLNTGLTRLQNAMFVKMDGGFPDQADRIETSRLAITDVMRTVTTDKKGIILQHTADGIAVQGLEPTSAEDIQKSF
jgi:hypothetical protein